MSKQRFTVSYASKRPAEQHVTITRNVADDSKTAPATTPETSMQAFLPHAAQKAETPTIDGYPVSAFLPHAAWACNGNPAARRTLLGFSKESAPPKPAFKKVTITGAFDGKNKDVFLVDPNAECVKAEVHRRAELAKQTRPNASEARIKIIMNIVGEEDDSPNPTELNPGIHGRIHSITQEELKKKELDEMQKRQEAGIKTLARIRATRENQESNLYLVGAIFTAAALVSLLLIRNKVDIGQAAGFSR